MEGEYVAVIKISITGCPSVNASCKCPFYNCVDTTAICNAMDEYISKQYFSNYPMNCPFENYHDMIIVSKKR